MRNPSRPDPSATTTSTDPDPPVAETAGESHGPGNLPLQPGPWPALLVNEDVRAELTEALSSGIGLDAVAEDRRWGMSLFGGSITEEARPLSEAHPAPVVMTAAS